MEDRVLGESRRERVAASAIHAFTGNNIQPKGDLASRSLEARITVDRPDPENRAFKHPDPLGWTLDHRREITAALYTILLGNPRLTQRLAGEKTRFKRWQRLVGSAIQNAAELAGHDMDFSKLFLKVEEKDEEAASLADALQHIAQKNAERKQGATFKSADVLTWASLENDEARALKEFFGGWGRPAPLPQPQLRDSSTRQKDAPVRVGGEVWTLTSALAGNSAQFGINKAGNSAHSQT